MNAPILSRDRKLAVNSDEFVHAMRTAATGVSVVTTNGIAGRFGLTVSAISSVSAEPPLLLVCVNRRNPSVAAITQNGHFAVNILAEDQEDVARSFSGRPAAGQPYDFSRYTVSEPESALPLVAGAAAHFECVIDSIHDAGTHRIFIGLVTSTQRNNTMPLIHTNRAYGRMVPFSKPEV
jgi:flavin reductase (DIM6/NTAB) family NADH-FMN oxidoreductase RutF